MAAGSRQDRFLARQRGAGARELQDDSFGFDVPTHGALTAPTTAGTAAQRSRRTPKSGASSASRTNRHAPSLRSSAQHEATFVDENGSVVKKRRLTPARDAITTPAQDVATARAGSGSGTGSQKASSGKKRKKRKSIGQGSLFKKRPSAQSRISAPIEEEDQIVENTIDGADGDDLAEDAANASEKMVAAQSGRAEEGPAARPVNTTAGRQETDTQSYKRRRKARKSTGGFFRRPNPVSPVVSTIRSPARPPEPESKPDEEPAVSEAEDYAIEDQAVENPGAYDQDAIEAGADAEGPRDETPTAPVAAKSKNEPRRKRRRKSVNPIQQERKKYRSSLEGARGDSKSPSAQPSARSTTRKLAITQPRPKLADKPPAKAVAARPQQSRGRLADRLASRRTPTAPVQRTTVPSRPKAADNDGKAKAGSVPITVFRLQNAPRLSPIPEEVEVNDDRPAASVLKGPNAIDALAQVCADLIQIKVDVAKQAEGDADGRAEKATARRKRMAIEAFGRELQSRLLDMTQAVDHHTSVQTRLRQAKKTRKTLRAQLLTSRGEEDELASDTYQLRAKRDLAAKVAEEDKQIVTLYKKLGRAIRDARNAQQEDDDLTPEGLDYELRNVERFTTAGGRQGLLGAMRSLNTSLETIAST